MDTTTLENSDDGTDVLEFVPAQFPFELTLPPGSPDLLAAVQDAVKREHRDSVKWKRLRCRRVKVLSETDTGTIFELQISHSVEFDLTWEGAVAFRPHVLTEDLDKQRPLFDQQGEEPGIEDSLLWRGEILEVDEATGRIFVCVADPEHPPRKGSFYVRPFELLSFLNEIYKGPQCDDIRTRLPDRLRAMEGNVHPHIRSSAPVELRAITEA